MMQRNLVSGRRLAFFMGLGCSTVLWGCNESASLITFEEEEEDQQEVDEWVDDAEGEAPELEDEPEEWAAVQVKDVFPRHEDADIPTWSHVAVTFSQSVDPDTVHSGSFFVRDSSGRPVNGEIENANPTWVFHPEDGLTLDNSYSIHITQDVEDLRGNALKVKYSTRFETRLGEWSDVALLDSVPTQWLTHPDVAASVDQKLIAVWQQEGVGVSDIYATEYDPVSGWGNARPIESGQGVAMWPQVVADADGNAVAAWIQTVGHKRQLWANRYDHENGWAVSRRVSELSGHVRRFQLTNNRHGEAGLAWVQAVGITDSGFVSLSSGDDWSSPSEFGTTELTSVVELDAALSEDGGLEVLWTQGAGATRHINANRYQRDIGWGDSTRLYNGADTSAATPRIHVDRSGEGIAVWTSHFGADSELRVARLDSESAWAESDAIGNAPGEDIFELKLLSNGLGDTWIAWSQANEMTSSVWTQRVLPTGYGQTSQVDPGGQTALFQDGGVDSAGNLTLNWIQSVGDSPNLVARRYTQGVGWSAMWSVEGEDDIVTQHAVCDVAPDGVSAVLWLQEKQGLNKPHGRVYR